MAVFAALDRDVLVNVGQYQNFVDLIVNINELNRRQSGMRPTGQSHQFADEDGGDIIDM